jgi:plastocyanin
VRGLGTVKPIAALAVAAALAAAPASGKGTKPEPAEKVSVQDNFFSPRSATVTVGEAVRWTWRGDNKHNITFKRVPRGAGRRGAAAKTEGRWQRTFRKAGRYRYVCTLFSGMRGTITVEAPENPPGN